MTKVTDCHAMSAEDILRALDSRPEGLSAPEVAARLAEYGPNVIEEQEEVVWFRTLVAQFLSPLIYILLIAAAISFSVGHAADGTVILAVVLINAIIGFIQEFRAERAMSELAKLAAPKAMVRRSGIDEEIPSSEVVPGDILVLTAGSRVPADARLLSVASLEADESALTGESTPVSKSTEPIAADAPLSDRKNMVYAGTVITRGRGEAVTCATGTDTQFGRIAHEVSSAHRQRTPLQNELAILGRNLGLIALGLAGLIFGAGVIRGKELFEMFLFAVAAAVSAIPEGLPAVVTVALAIGLSAMARRNAIIRRLPAVETLGSATVIVSDKTGTLTQNVMTVRAVHFPGSETSLEPDQLPNNQDARLILKAAALANDAQLRQKDGQEEVVGDPTETALVVAAAKAGLLKVDLERECPRIDEIPFESQKGYMATLNRCPDGLCVFVKGAPEVILNMCERARVHGSEIPLNDDLRQFLKETNTSLASRALRVLAVAYKRHSGSAERLNETELKHDLVHLGLIGMMDPPRPEAIGALEKCRSAGIRVIMATGDNPETARAIARELGLISNGSVIVSGSELARLSEDTLRSVVTKAVVFARVEPEHKLRLVNALKQNGEIVAVTGDGINDAPALKTADIGVAMGKTGTAVAREAGDMILADDNFATIVAAVEEGRIVFERIRKVVGYLVATNAGELLTFTIAVASGMPLPLTAVQILWINLVTDSGPSLALSVDPPTSDVLAKPPRDPSERVINRSLLTTLAVVAPAMALAGFGAFFIGLGHGLPKAQTLVFLTLSLSQLFNAVNVRAGSKSVFRTSLFANHWLIVAILVALALQALPIHIPSLQKPFNTTPVSSVDWAMSIGLASIVLWTAEIRKLIIRRLNRE